MLKSDEMKKYIAAKRNEVEKFQQEMKMKDAVKAAGELEKLMDEYKIAINMEQSDLQEFQDSVKKGNVTKIVPTNSTDIAELRRRAFNKLVLNPARGEKQPLTDEERNAYFNVSGSPGAPAQIESIPSKGGYLVPQEQFATLQEFRKEFVALKDHVSVVNTNSTSGIWATFSPQDLEFQSFAEMTSIAESDVSFGQATFVIQDKGLILPISNQLIDDANIDIISFMGRQLAEASVRTENKEILTALNKFVNGDTDLSIAAATSITTHKGLNAALFQTLDGSYLQAAKIVTNQDGFLWLSNLDDSQNRPLLQPDVTAPNIYRYHGKEIVVVPNTTLPSTTASTKTYAPFFVGDLRSCITFFQRQGMELATSRELFFAKYGIALRAVIRFGVVIVDKNAVVPLKVEV